MDLVAETSNGEFYKIPMASVADINHDMVQRQIIEREHPHPMLLMTIVLIVIMLIYYIYVQTIKRDFGGEWYCEKYKAVVNHNKWNDRLEIKIDSDVFDGRVAGNAIYMISADDHDNVLMGVYHDGVIHWIFGSGIGGTVWRRAKAGE